MKAVDLAKMSPSLAELLKLASEENVILTTSEGRRFVLAEIDDFAEEVAQVRQNTALMQLLDERSRETATFTLSQAREQLRAKKRGRPNGRNAKKRK
jgi:hypothetical protein